MANGKIENFGPDWNSVARTIALAAEHIEELCPRPGPYHPAFAALLELSDTLKWLPRGPG